MEKQLRKQISTGTDNFKKLVESNCYLVDKTDMIGEVLTDASEVLLFTRPRRFGKSLNMSMLYYYLSNQEDGGTIFKGLNIDKEEIIKKDKFDNIVKIIKTEEYQNQYPVILMSFKEIKSDNYDDAYSDIQLLIASVYNKYHYLLKSDKLSNYDFFNYKIVAEPKIDSKTRKIIPIDEAMLKKSLKELSIMLEKHHGKRVYIIIDEYDTPIIKAQDNGYYEEMVLFMSNLFGEVLKSNTALEKGILTGILRIAKESIFSDLNNLTVYSITDSKYSQYFGFIQEEVNEMARYYRLDNKLDEIKEWYDGYRFGKNEIYNPWSILNYFKDEDNALKCYWINTSSNTIIHTLFNEADYKFKEQFYELLNCNKDGYQLTFNENIVYREIKSDSSVIWTLLLMSGYLKIVEVIDIADGKYKVTIPNKEVSKIYEDVFSKWLDKIMDTRYLIVLFNAMINKNIIAFENILTDIFKEVTTTFYQNEGHYQNLFVGIATAFRDTYIISQEVNTFNGRADVIMESRIKDKYPSIIIEFKKGDDVKKATNQITKKEYYSEFKKRDITNYICYGIAINGKLVKINIDKITF